MGIFAKLLGSSSGIEKELEATYVPIFQTTRGMTLAEAISAFSYMINKAKEESLKEGTSKMPKNFGDYLLEKEAIDPNIKSMLTKRRSEGVRDEDIRWWWNLHDLERRIKIEDDNWCGFALFKHFRESGLSEEEAGKKLRKSRPIYGNSDDTSTFTEDDDKPLPYELKDRINIYMINRSEADKEGLMIDIDNSSSFNALIRKEIRKRIL